MKIYILRHCESVHNANNRSGTNCPLTEKGILQAKNISGHFDVVICSPLLRAIQTLKNSKITYDKLHTSHLCREICKDTGDFLEHEDITYREPESKLKHRANKFKNELNKYNENKKILVVTHYHFIYHMTGLHLKNGELFEYTF